jgi:hypothetical protein
LPSLWKKVYIAEWSPDVYSQESLVGTKVQIEVNEKIYRGVES